MALLTVAFTLLYNAQPVYADETPAEQQYPQEIHSGCSHSDALYHFYATGNTYVPEYWYQIGDPEYFVEGMFYNGDSEAEGPYHGEKTKLCAEGTSERYPTDFFKNGYAEGWYYFGGDGFYFCTDKAEADKAAAESVVAKINAIGTVEYTGESKEKIDEARTAYDALTTDQKALVTAAQLTVLTDAETEYAALKADSLRTEITADMIDAVPAKTYTGSAIEPDVTVKDGDTVLTKDVDYTVSYSKNISAGNAEIKVTGINKYKGETTVSFVINPADTDSNDHNKDSSWIHKIFLAVAEMLKFVFQVVYYVALDVLDSLSK